MYSRADRRPKPSRVTAWSRALVNGRVIYRLFRRDLAGAWHYEARSFSPYDEPCFIAERLRKLRRELKGRVDTMDLARMGVEA